MANPAVGRPSRSLLPPTRLHHPSRPINLLQAISVLPVALGWASARTSAPLQGEAPIFEGTAPRVQRSVPRRGCQLGTSSPSQPLAFLPTPPLSCPALPIFLPACLQLGQPVQQGCPRQVCAHGAVLPGDDLHSGALCPPPGTAGRQVSKHGPFGVALRCVELSSRNVSKLAPSRAAAHLDCHPRSMLALPLPLNPAPAACRLACACSAGCHQCRLPPGPPGAGGHPGAGHGRQVGHPPRGEWGGGRKEAQRRAEDASAPLRSTCRRFCSSRRTCVVVVRAYSLNPCFTAAVFPPPLCRRAPKSFGSSGSCSTSQTGASGARPGLPGLACRLGCPQRLEA
jgi:hypothetical protein